MKEIAFENFDGSGLKIGIVVARWNSDLTYALRDDCKKALLDAGLVLDNIIVQEVPGAYEVVYGSKHLIEQGVDAVVAIGCLIKGETMHFEYIAEAVSQGIMDLNTNTSVPVIFGILTCISEEQARERSIGEKSHGYAWGQSAIEMALLRK
jgi:6,7-dimethyl-8-ribityllumazine synthase